MDKKGTQSTQPAPQAFPVILASNSPRRRELLRLTGLGYRVAPADVDETPFPDEPADEYVLRMAKEKACAAAEVVAASQSKGGEWIIAADTTVADGDEILGKPQDAAEAFAMLAQLRNREHQVHTAVAVYRRDTDRLEQAHCTELACPGQLEAALATTNVPMRNYSDDEIDAYIATGDPFDKAGSYAIQHPDFRPVDALTGCYANVVGLPLCHLERVLRALGFAPSADIPAACQSALGYACTVYPQVQKGEL